MTSTTRMFSHKGATPHPLRRRSQRIEVIQGSCSGVGGAGTPRNSQGTDSLPVRASRNKRQAGSRDSSPFGDGGRSHHGADSELSPLSFQLPPAGSSVAHKTRNPFLSTECSPLAKRIGSALPILSDGSSGGPDWMVRAE